MPKQYQLLHALSKSLFLDAEFKCVVVISKTPYLTALIACHGAKKEILPPYDHGTCLLLPKSGCSNTYVHAVIDKIETIGDQNCYWYRDRKVRSNSVCDPGIAAKPCSEIEQHGKVFPHKTPEDWLGKHDISSDDLHRLANSAFPALIGHDSKAKVDYWKKVPLGIESNHQLTMENILDLSSQSSTFSNLNTYSPRSLDPKRYENQIWVNAVPDTIETGRFLIILSPTHSNSRFMDLIDQVNNTYANNRLSPVEHQNIPPHLTELGITNRALLVTTLMRESIK